MTTKHLSETALQQYALDKTECDHSVIQHIQSCESCRAKVATYESLFVVIKEQPAPAFDFDLTGLVVKQLPRKKPVLSPAAVLFTLIALCPFGIIGYIGRDYIQQLLTGSSAMFLYLALATVFTVLIFQAIDAIKRYNKQMSALNY